MRTNAMWAGRVFMCGVTGEKFTIPVDVSACDFYTFGESSIDVGRDDSYYRMSGNPIEIVEERNVQEYPFLPHWATGRAFGEIVLGAQLSTRDGRKVGNGWVVGIEDITDPDWNGGAVYTYLSDAGNTLQLTEKEVDGLFYRPVWVGDLEDIIQKFMRK